MEFKTLEIVQKNLDSPIFHLLLNNPSRRNALSEPFFTELPLALDSLDRNPSALAVILAANGDHFCSGIDLQILNSQSNPSSTDPGRTREHLRRSILNMQSAITAIERCRKPVIAAIHGACIGGGIDLVTACDIRVSTADALFCVKEVELGLTADLGTLQRLPGLVGFGNAMELALTGRGFRGGEAKEMGLVQRVYGSRREMEEGVRALAEGIAEKSPLAVAGTKAVLLRSRDLSLSQGLDYVATWNSAMLLSDDLKEAVSAHFQKRKPVFAKL